MRAAFPFFLVLLLCTGCTDADAPQELESIPVKEFQVAPIPSDSFFLAYDRYGFRAPTVDSADAARWADSVLAGLSVEEKIGQLFIVHLPGSRLRQLIADEARAAILSHQVGGFLVPRLMAPHDVFERTRSLQQISKIPLFFAADYERGVGRFNNPFTELPSNMALGATRDTAFAAAAGRLTAIESHATGINLLFAPVVDVNNNPANPIINIRSYGEDPELVGHMAAAFVRQAECYGILTTLKHFPGHGNTSIDSHTRMGVVFGDRAALDSIELRPYQIILGQAQRPSGVMSTHLWIQALDEQPLPATFSRRALHDLLRDTLGFDGFVVTDDVKMGALQNDYDLEERVVRPLLAGADIILTPANLGRAAGAVRSALQQGQLHERDLDRSVRRILLAKARANLHRQPLADPAHLAFIEAQPHGAVLAQAMADRALTLLKTHPTLPLDTQRVALVQLSNYRDSESIGAAMDLLQHMLGQHGTVREVRYDGDPSNAVIDRVVQRADASDVVVLALYLRLVAGRGEAGLLAQQERLVSALLARDTPVVLVTFGNPYAVSTFADADAILVAYDQTLESVRTAAGILQGRQPPRGKLPVTVAPYSFGSGLDSPR